MRAPVAWAAPQQPKRGLRERASRWGESKLAELPLALTSGLHIVSVSARRVDDVVGRIGGDHEGRHTAVAATHE